MKLGYARVSTEDQNLEIQRGRLSEAGCEMMFEEKISGAARGRPELEKLMGHLRNRSGSVRLRGEHIEHLPVYQIARRGLGFVPEDRRIFAELTVWENLDVALRSTSRRGRWDIEAVYGLFPKLRELKERAAAGEDVEVQLDYWLGHIETLRSRAA